MTDYIKAFTSLVEIVGERPYVPLFGATEEQRATMDAWRQRATGAARIMLSLMTTDEDPGPAEEAAWLLARDYHPFGEAGIDEGCDPRRVLSDWLHTANNEALIWWWENTKRTIETRTEGV